MQGSHLRRRGFWAAHVPGVGTRCFANMAQFDSPALEIRDDNQVSAHRGDEGSKLVDMNISVPFFEF